MKYKTVKITDQIILVIVKDRYERAMLFCKAQEFYESPCRNFRGKKFSIWDYMSWYSEKTGCFSYPKDFSGFNMPMVVAKKCYESNEIETPYDKVMSEIVERYFVNGERRYLIGTGSMKGSTFEHELCHALYYTDLKYKNTMDSITKTIPKKNIDRFAKNLSSMGYHSSVLKDEVQAYMATEVNSRLCSGVSGTKRLHASYRSVFKKMRPII